MSILTLETKKYAIKIENFEGPLDLLCHLIEKNNNFSTKKKHIVVLTSNEFRQLEILYGEIPQSPF